VAATTAALSIGITLMTLFTVVFSSVQASTDDAVAGHFPFDYIVAASGSQPVPPRIVSALRAAPELGMVADVYSEVAAVDGSMTPLSAYSHNALGVAVRPAMTAGSLTQVGPGTAAVGTGLGNVGGTITVSTPSAGRERLRIVAVYNAATHKSPIPPVIISTTDFARGFPAVGATEAVIDAAPGVSTARSRAAVAAAIASDPLLTMSTLADYKASLDSGVDSIIDLVGALLGLAILIALFGISNTLTLSVIERTPESALLRALGLTRGQLRGMLFAEALLMAALSVLLGASLGIWLRRRPDARPRHQSRAVHPVRPASPVRADRGTRRGSRRHPPRPPGRPHRPRRRPNRPLTQSAPPNRRRSRGRRSR
jgi:putative ABC transport system permease protein